MHVITVSSTLRALVFIGALVFTLSAAARDAFVLLSGGGSPLGNNYSQYLQAKAVAKFLRSRYPADSVWTFFGAGNVEGEAPFFSDVRRQYKKDGLVLESWLPGPLPHNRPAKREVFLKALREEILPAVRDGGTLFLFVGDHGSQPRGERVETTIDLWGIDPDPTTERRWKFVNHEHLNGTELQRELAAGLGRGRVVFCMTQCYSGGFHFLGIPRHVTPDPAWFRGVVPDWAAPDEEQLPRVAGFTATDHYSLAAGCSPDPDPDRWAGYERFVPENLLGLDLFSLEPVPDHVDSFYAAHVAATLVDTTIDKPQATSERYLERWAALIETKLASASAPSLEKKVRQAVAAYAKAVDTGRVKLKSPEARERQKLFASFIQRLGEQAPASQDTLLHGTRADLEKLTGVLPPAANFEVAANAPRPDNRTGSNETRQLWKEVLQPAWRDAVQADKIAALREDPIARRFEETLLAEEAKGRDLMFASNWQSPLLPFLFWAMGGNKPGSVDVATAEGIARWGATRRRTIMQWVRAETDPAVHAAAEKVFPERNRPASAPATSSPTAAARATGRAATLSTRPLAPKTAAERTLFYRRVLAAWAFLETIGDQAALDKVRELTELERTPLPLVSFPAGSSPYMANLSDRTLGSPGSWLASSPPASVTSSLSVRAKRRRSANAPQVARPNLR